MVVLLQLVVAPGSAHANGGGGGGVAGLDRGGVVAAAAVEAHAAVVDGGLQLFSIKVNILQNYKIH